MNAEFLTISQAMQQQAKESAEVFRSLEYLYHAVWSNDPMLYQGMLDRLGELSVSNSLVIQEARKMLENMADMGPNNSYTRVASDAFHALEGRPNYGND